MKFKILIALSILFLSCNNEKSTEITKQTVTLKSNILLQTTIIKPYSSLIKDANFTLTIQGKSLLNGLAILKVINANGEELTCDSFPAKELIQKEYKTANSALKEVHLREVVEGYFAEDSQHYAKNEIALHFQ